MPVEPTAGHGTGVDPVSQYGLRTVLAVVAVIGWWWASAQLGALASHHRLAPITLADAAVALVQLPHHLATPANAWPGLARPALAGPVVYWTITVLLTALAAAIATAVLARVRGGRRFEQRVARPGASGFARRAELGPLTVTEPSPGRLSLGTVRSRLIAAEPQTSLAVVGPTGCGKTAGFAIPALHEWDGPVIATSVKTDLIDASIFQRAARGRVWIYDPTQCGTRTTSTWSPLSACHTWAGAMRVAAWLCEAAQPRTDTVTDGDYWYSQARKALAPYLHAAALGGRSMRDVVRWIDQQEQGEVETILQTASGYTAALERLLATSKAEARRDELRKQAELDKKADLDDDQSDPRLADQSFASSANSAQADFQTQVRAEVEELLKREYAPQAIREVSDSNRTCGADDALIAAHSLWGKEERQRGSVFATVENVVAGYADPRVAQAANTTDGESIDLGEWLDGDNTIFVVATAHEQARLRPVLTVLVQQAVRAAYETANDHGGTLPHPCLVLLDEAGNIAPLRDLPTYASTARSHGISLVTIWQDLSQLRAIYGDRARTVLNNHQAKLFGAGIADDATLEYVSRLVGDERRRELNVSGDLHGPRRSISEHTTYRRAAPVDTLRRLPRDEAILLYSNLAPIHLHLRPWYRATRSWWRRVAFGRSRRA